MKKKILAGLMASATILSTSAVSFATSDNGIAPTDKDYTSVTKVGETKYSVAASTIEIPLTLTVPKKMVAYLNPYGAKVKVDTKATPTEVSDGVLSWYYEIKNDTKDFGVTVDLIGGSAKTAGDAKLGTAADLPATGKMIDANGEKKVVIALVSSTSGSATTPGTMPTLSSADATTGNAKAGAATGGKFYFSDTATNLTKFAYVKGVTSTQTGTQITQIAFKGNIALTTAATNGEDIVWGSKDKVTTTFSLKFAPTDPTNAPT